VNFTLYSDGGGVRDSVAAGACILEDRATGRRENLVVFLGGATNNESEITAGLLGFSLLKARYQSLSGCNVHWVSDSEYTLKSATSYIQNWQKNGWKTANRKPVKNQGLWRTYLHLSAGAKVSTEHVAGHAGHVENEACDQASTWAQLNAAEALSTSSSLSTPVEFGGSSWLLLDGRGFIQAMRSDHPTVAESEGLMAIVSG